MSRRKKGGRPYVVLPAENGTRLVSPAPRLLWKEFREFDAHAVEWIRAGNVALTPGVVERIAGGVSMYVHAKDAAAFAHAAAMIDTDPKSVPVGRTGANVDREFLLRAILLCRAGSVDSLPVGPSALDALMRCGECSAPLDKIAEHSFGITGEITTAVCVRGHRWRV